MDNTLGYEPGNGGSIPSGGTSFRMRSANFIHLTSNQNRKKASCLF